MIINSIIIISSLQLLLEVRHLAKKRGIKEDIIRAGGALANLHHLYIFISFILCSDPNRFCRDISQLISRPANLITRFKVYSLLENRQQSVYFTVTLSSEAAVESSSHSQATSTGSLEPVRASQFNLHIPAQTPSASNSNAVKFTVFRHTIIKLYYVD